MKFWSKKAADLTVGETMKFTCVLTVVLTAIGLAINVMIYKYDKICEAISDAKYYIKNKFTSKKGKRVAEENGLY